MFGSQDEIPPPPLPPPSSSQTPTQQTPHTVSTIKLPILKRGEYDIWAMKMKHYLAHIDYPIWEVIQNGNGPVSITTDTQGQIKKPREIKDNRRRDAWNSGNKDRRRSGSDTETQPSESETQTSEFDTCKSNISTETPELVSEPVVNESNVAFQPKVWSDAPIIEEYEDYPHKALQNKGIVDSGCSRHMTGNKAYLAVYQDFIVALLFFILLRK
ncbi:hypothetical protein Tco_0614830 [Tanacetum coccineum]